VRSLALLAVLLPALAFAGTITTGPTPEEQAKAAKTQAAKAQPAKKAPAKKPPPKATKSKTPAAKAPATQPAPKPAMAPEPEDGPPASPARPSSAKENFRKAYPCPSTGRSSGSCPGYDVEHMNPPACGGADSPGNMQWVPASATRKKGAPECKTG
jgi:outer membrane biosynthesis protein TonB